LYPEWSRALFEETGVDNGYRRCGGLYLARSVGEAAALAGLVGFFGQQRIPIRRLTPEELAGVEPGLTDVARTGELKAAYFTPDEAQLRNPRHLQALAAACRARGVRISEGVEVLGFQQRGDRLLAVQTNSGPFPAGNFAITTGAWTFGLLQALQVPCGIMPIRGQMVLFRCHRRPLDKIINEGPRYLVARDDGRVLAGSSEEEAGYDKSTTPSVIAELVQMAWELIPALREAEIERTWAGLRPGSFDGMPYLGRMPGLENAFVAAGHYRSGLHMSPATAVVLSQLIRGETPAIDLTVFRVSRG